MSLRRPLWRAVAGAVLALLGTDLLAQGSDPAAAARTAQANLTRAAEALTEAQSARDRVAALTKTVRAYEDGLVALRDGMRRVAIRETSLTRALDAKSDEIAELLAALQTMGRAPAPLLLLHPTGPMGTARSGMILSEVTPALVSEADRLRVTLEELSALQSLQSEAAQTLQNGLDGAQSARAALATAIDERTDLPRRFDEDPVQTALLLASSATLDSFAQNLRNASPEGTAPQGAQDLRGALPLPVSGTVLRQFKETDAAGHTRPGLVIATQPRALVTVPRAATLRFAGPLLDYGTVAILEPAADLLLVFAGLEEVFGTPGDVLPEGAPLGLMGGSPAAAQDFLQTGGGIDRPESLYIEVRDAGIAVDPARWFVLE